MISFLFSLFFSLALNFSFAAPTCTEIFQSTLYVKTSNANSARTTPLITHITRSNVRDVFSHNYARDPNVIGAKAIVLMLPDQAPEVYFFATGDGKKPWRMHHMEALKTVLLNKYNIHIGEENNWDPSVFTIAQYAQGYEFTANKTPTGLRIVRIDTNSQLLKMRHLMNYDDAAFDNTAMPLILSRIDPFLLSLSKPRQKDPEPN